MKNGNDCFNPREIKLLTWSLRGTPLYILLIVIAKLATGCVTVEGDDPDTIVVIDNNDCDGGVPDTDAAPSPDASPDAAPVLPFLHFQFGGPLSGTEVATGAQNEPVLCYNMSANADMEIRRFRVRLSAQHGFLLNGSTPRFGDIKIVGGSGNVIAGPMELDVGGSSWTQTFVMNDVFGLAAGQTTGGCIQLDVSADPGLHNEHIAVALLPFESGDVVVTGDNSELQPAQSDIGSGLSTELVLKAPTGVMTYTLAPDDTESAAGIVVGGSTNVVLAKYRFTATGDSLKQTKLRFRLSDVVFDPSVPHGVAQVTLWDGTTQIGSAVPPNGSGFVDFSSFAFVVPQDFTKTLTVKATLNQVGPAAANSGIDVGVTLCAGNNDGPCWTGGPEPQEDGTYEVRSAATNAVVDTIGNSGNIQGRTKILRKTKPTVVLNSLPTSTLSNGTQTISRFTITADAAGNVSLKTILLQSTLVDTGSAILSISSPTLREVGQGTNLPIVPFAVTCTAGSNCITQLTFATEEVIAAGTSRTYELRVNVTGADTAGESISTKLLGDTTRVTGSLAGFHGEVVGTGAYHFIWSDMSAIPHSAVVGGSADWTNGRFVRVLPTDTQTLVRD